MVENYSEEGFMLIKGYTHERITTRSPPTYFLV